MGKFARKLAFFFKSRSNYPIFRVWASFILIGNWKVQYAGLGLMMKELEILIPCHTKEAFLSSV